MNTEQVKLLLDVESKKLDKLNKKLDMMFKSIQKNTRTLNLPNFSKQFDEVSRSVEQTTKSVNKLTVQSSALGQIWENSKDGVFGFNGALLSTLFFGMEMQRIFGGVLTGIFEGYKKIIPESAMFNTMTTRLSANWEFFKFQLADALANSPLFQALIGYAINLLKWFQGLSETTKTWIAISMGVLAVVGAFMLYVSIIALGVAGLADLAVAAKGAKLSLASIKPIPILVGAAVLAGLLLGKKALDSFYDSSELGSNAAENMKSVWTDTLNSVINPLAKAFGGTSLEIKNFDEAMIVLGVTIHNMLIVFGMLVDIVIFIGRTLINIVSIAIRPFIASIETAADAIGKLLDGDWDGALDAASNYFSNYADGVMTDIADIGDAWNTMSSNFENKALALEGYGPALDAYRSELSTYGINSGSNQQVVQQTTFVMMNEALADGTISNEQYNAYLQANQFQTGN